jgi:hypothetical protein
MLTMGEEKLRGEVDVEVVDQKEAAFDQEVAAGGRDEELELVEQSGRIPLFGHLFLLAEVEHLDEHFAHGYFFGS